MIKAPICIILIFLNHLKLLVTPQEVALGGILSQNYQSTNELSENFNSSSRDKDRYITSEEVL